MLPGRQRNMKLGMHTSYDVRHNNTADPETVTDHQFSDGNWRAPDASDESLLLVG